MQIRLWIETLRTMFRKLVNSKIRCEFFKFYWNRSCVAHDLHAWSSLPPKWNLFSTLKFNVACSSSGNHKELMVVSSVHSVNSNLHWSKLSKQSHLTSVFFREVSNNCAVDISKTWQRNTPRKSFLVSMCCVKDVKSLLHTHFHDAVVCDTRWIEIFSIL